MKDGEVWNTDACILHFRQIVHVVYIGKESTLMHVDSAATTTLVNDFKGSCTA